MTGNIDPTKNESETLAFKDKANRLIQCLLSTDRDALIRW